MKTILILLFFFSSLYSKVLISPIDSMKNSFGTDADISKKSVLLKKCEAKTISKNAKMKLDSKLFRVFKATKDDKTLGYGILIKKKVRSKNAAILYIMDTSATLKGIEIIAFNEPMEYLPSKKWNSQFENMKSSQSPQVGKDIATITGATLSAQSITNSARIALAFYNEKLKEK